MLSVSFKSILFQLSEIQQFLLNCAGIEIQERFPFLDTLLVENLNLKQPLDRSEKEIRSSERTQSASFFFFVRNVNPT